MTKKKECNFLNKVAHQIYTNEDLEQFCENLFIDQFKEVAEGEAHVVKDQDQ